MSRKRQTWDLKPGLPKAEALCSSNREQDPGWTQVPQAFVKVSLPLLTGHTAKSKSFGDESVSENDSVSQGRVYVRRLAPSSQPLSAIVQDP